MYDKGNSKDKTFIIYIKSLLRALLLTVVLLLVVALIYFFADLSMESLKTAVWIVAILSICLGGIYAAGRIGSKGFIHGAASGLLYMALLGALMLLYDGSRVNFRSYAIMLVTSIIIGAFSGIIGVVLNNN
jgi:putative membrane protein (TIGR04086 family)